MFVFLCGCVAFSVFRYKFIIVLKYIYILSLEGYKFSADAMGINISCKPDLCFTSMHMYL